LKFAGVPQTRQQISAVSRPIFTIIIIIIILFAIKSMIYKTHGQKQYDRTTRHTNAPTVAHE